MADTHNDTAASAATTQRGLPSEWHRHAWQDGGGHAHADGDIPHHHHPTAANCLRNECEAFPTHNPHPRPLFGSGRSET